MPNGVFQLVSAKGIDPAFRDYSRRKARSYRDHSHMIDSVVFVWVNSAGDDACSPRFEIVDTTGISRPSRSGRAAQHAYDC